MSLYGRTYVEKMEEGRKIPSMGVKRFEQYFLANKHPDLTLGIINKFNF